MNKKIINDFLKNIIKNIVIGIILILSAIPVFYLLSYFLSEGNLDPTIFLISTITGWCTICFKLWIDFIREKTKIEKIFSTLIFLFVLPWVGICVFIVISPQPVLKIYIAKALFSWFFGSIIGILYEVIKPKKILQTEQPSENFSEKK